MDTPSNLFDDLPGNFPEEIIQTMLNKPGLRIERIFSRGHASPEGSWYDQESHEWVLLVQGAARMRFEGEESFEMTPGSFIDIPSHTRHRVEWTDPNQTTIWLAIHY